MPVGRGVGEGGQERCEVVRCLGPGVRAGRSEGVRVRVRVCKRAATAALEGWVK